MEEVWYTLDDIEVSDDDSKLYCISVDSPEKQFLAGRIKVPTHNSEEGKAEDALKGEASMIIGSIARLGRAAGVHLVIATQRPDAKIIAGETKANLGVRINCGRTDSNASSMILGTSDGTRVKANPRGRLYLRIYGSGDHGQGFFAQSSWIDEYLESRGLNPDGTPLTRKKSRLANIADMSQFEGADLDAREGIDNEKVIEKIRAEETSISADDDFEDLLNDDDGDWDFDPGDESPSNSPGSIDRPTLTDGKGDSDRFHRAEDDWDSELEDLIDKNFE